MKVLALNSSTSVGGAAAVENGRLVAELALDVTATHAERLMPAVSSVMEEAGWSGPPNLVVVALGPGSFTGVRIAVATAKSLAYGWDVPVVGVTTLEALAWQASWQAGIICPLVDARRGQAYYQVFRAHPGGEVRVEEVSEPGIQLVTDIVKGLPEEGRITFLGDGAVINREAIITAVGDRAVFAPDGFEILRSTSVAMMGMKRFAAGKAADPLTLTPFYLRRSEAEIRWEKKHL